MIKIECPECGSDRITADVYCNVKLELIDQDLYGELEDLDSVSSPNENDPAGCWECGFSAPVSAFLKDVPAD